MACDQCQLFLVIAGQSQWINAANWISLNIAIRIDPTRQPDGIALQVPPRIRQVLPVPVVPQARFGIVVLPREPQVQSPDAVGGHRAVERMIAGLPDNGLAAVGRQLRPAQLVVVQIDDLIAAHHRHRLVAVPDVAGPLPARVLGQQPVVPGIHVAAAARRVALAHPLVQRVHRVGRRDARPGMTGQPAERIVGQGVGHARSVGEGGDVAVGVVGERAGQAAGNGIEQPMAGGRQGVAGAVGRTGVAGAGAVARQVVAETGL